MSLLRNMSLTLRIAFASAWAGLLLLLGLWLVLDWSDRFPTHALACRVGGVTAIAMGEFVFAALVADRLFPRAYGPLRAIWQGGSAVLYVAGVATLVLILFGAFA